MMQLVLLLVLAAVTYGLWRRYRPRENQIPDMSKAWFAERHRATYRKDGWRV
jgi:hypothetical protein